MATELFKGYRINFEQRNKEAISFSVWDKTDEIVVTGTISTSGRFVPGNRLGAFKNKEEALGISDLFRRMYEIADTMFMLINFDANKILTLEGCHVYDEGQP